MRSFRLTPFVLLFLFAVPGYAYRTAAWVPAWDSNATTILQQQAGNLSESNPGWYYANADGTITITSSGIDSRLRAALSGTELVPTIKNYVNGSFDGAMMETIVASSTLREKHAEAIAQLAVVNAYDGIDVDYERMSAASKSNFTAFVNLLASKLHASGKKLSVTVYPKTSDADTWSGPGAQDWSAIGAAADSVKIMAYDYHWSTSAAGPIAPLAWLANVATYAGRTLPSGKAIMGLPWYGYDWLGTRGTGVTFAQATAKAQSAGATIARDVNGELTYTYSGRTVFFQDATSYQKKIDAILAANPAIGGFAHWRVGAEDPATWDHVASVKNSGRTSIVRPMPVSSDFAISGPGSIDVTAGAAAQATFGYDAINGFAGAVDVTVRQIDEFPGTFALDPSTLTLTVWPSRKATAGTYRLEVVATSGALERTHIVNVTVAATSNDKRRSVR